MNKNLAFVLIIALGLLHGNRTFAQTDSSSQRFQVAIFTPLYIDSAFDSGNNYRYGSSFPKFINPGLEFYEGLQLAIDSMSKEGVNLDIHIYDTKSSTEHVSKIISDSNFKNVDLIIGHVTANEARMLADVAARISAPFINVNYPNDAGITNNPDYVILNSTLSTHISALYKFLQKNFAVSPITVFTKKGANEDVLKGYLTGIEKSTASVPLKLKYVTLDDNFTGEQLQKYLDSNITNVALVASLDVNFGTRLTEELSTLSESYTITVFGMPTWDAIDFAKPEFKTVEVYYGTPFYIAPNEKLAEATQTNYRNIFYARPSDMVYRGHEVLYHFGHLLAIHGKNLGSSLSDKHNKLYSDFDIQPVIDPKTQVFNYYENKKIYFIKKVDGVVKGVY
jgi:hypothetical protein